MAKNKGPTFHEWIKSYGASKLAQKAGICRTTPYKWLSGTGRIGLDLALVIRKIAKADKVNFTIEEITGRTNE